MIWLLTIVMAITFGALLYFQIMYLENMVKMREAQFSEAVMRCLSATSSNLERTETLHFLEEDVNVIEANLYDDYTLGSGNNENIKYSVALMEQEGLDATGAPPAMWRPATGIFRK